MKVSKKLLCIAPAFIISVFTVYAQFASLSPAMEVIKGSMELKKCGVINSDVAFSEADFESVLREGVEYITITSLPDSSDGVLTINGVRVMENQTVSRNGMASLKFEPVKGRECAATFSFEDSLDKEFASICTVNILPGVNLSPETGEQTLETQKNIAAFKFLLAADPEDDALDFEIVSYPQNGSVIMPENSGGAFGYVPVTDFVGKDSFVYVATDVYGNKSNPQKVEINVSKPACEAYFDDMKNHWAHNSAVKMASTGLMLGQNKDGKLVFGPDDGMTRGDFLAVAIIMAGFEKDVPEVNKTVFADDDQIPQNIKSYAQYAYDKGIVSGYTTSDGKSEFASTKIITRAEAAVMVDKILSLPKAQKDCDFKDAAAIPGWANSSVSSLTACGILNGTGGGSVNSQNELTKGEAAEMICNVAQYLEDKEAQQQAKQKPKKTLFNLFGLIK